MLRFIFYQSEWGGGIIMYWIQIFGQQYTIAQGIFKFLVRMVGRNVLDKINKPSFICYSCEFSTFVSDRCYVTCEKKFNSTNLKNKPNFNIVATDIWYI